MAPATEWDLLFFVPNVSVPTTTPFDGGVVRLCAGTDPLLQQLHLSPGNIRAARMLQRFQTQFGHRYLPACIVVQHGAPRVARHAETLRAFRNCCAISTILPAYKGAQWEPTFSDHFDIYPLAPARSGWIVTNDAIVRGLHRPQGFRGAPSPLIQAPTQFTYHPARRLLGRLIIAWRRCYLRSRRRRELNRLFRSIEIALHACRFPTDSLLSLHDAGLRLVLWVSAFEILLHPQGGRVRLPPVLGVIRTLEWNNRRLAARRYSVTYTNVPPRVSLPEAVYYDLYMARNDFGHGNEVPARRLWFRRDRRRALLSELAPLIYWKVLERRLDQLFPAQNIQPPAGGGAGWLLTPRGQRYMAQRAAQWADMQGLERALLQGASS